MITAELYTLNLVDKTNVHLSIENIFNVQLRLHSAIDRMGWTQMAYPKSISLLQYLKYIIRIWLF